MNGSRERIGMNRTTTCLLLWAGYVLMLLGGNASGESLFSFRNTVHGIDMMSSGTLTSGDFTMQLAAGPANAGALFREFNAGLGIVSRATAGMNDPSLDTFNVLSDDDGNPLGGETMTFSFNRAGVLTELDFDGVKDEAYEYFLLQTSTSPDLYFFDSFINTMGGDPNLIDVPGQVVFLQEGSSGIDDKSPPLKIPFVAGQQFVLTYGQLDGIQPGQQMGNGARLQGITVVPEPRTLLLTLAAVAGVLHFVSRSR